MRKKMLEAEGTLSIMAGLPTELQTHAAVDQYLLGHICGFNSSHTSADKFVGVVGGPRSTHLCWE